MAPFEPDQGDQAMRVRVFVQTAAILTLAVVAGMAMLTQEIDGHNMDVESSEKELQTGDHSIGQGVENDLTSLRLVHTRLTTGAMRTSGATELSSDYRAVGMCGHTACHNRFSDSRYLTDQSEANQPKLRVSSSHVVSTTDP